MKSKAVWLFARPGFEEAAGREWQEAAAEQGVRGFLEPQAGSGLVRFIACGDGADPATLRQRLPIPALVFVRDAVFELARVAPLPASDRVGAVSEALFDALGNPVPEGSWGEVLVHVPEGSADRHLPGFARKWTAPLASTLRSQGWLTPHRRPGGRRLDLILQDFERLVIAESWPASRSAFPGGRPRLRLPSDAPSRSSLKLEEAFRTLLDGDERRRLLAPGMRAVDLGASPGGWTFSLLRRGLSVTAVDNGPLDASLLAGGRVTHVRADGFTWLPGRTCDWLVCDIVDKPRRTAALVGRWFSGGYCRASIFNLKLPMKKRLEEWRLCRERLDAVLVSLESPFEVRAKQLYHDREEITVAVLPRRAEITHPGTIR